MPGTNFDPNIDEPSHALAIAVSLPQFMWVYDLLYNYSGYDFLDKMYAENLVCQHGECCQSVRR